MTAVKEINGTPSKEGFEWFCLIMKEHNFSKIGGKQIRQDFTRLDLQKQIRKLEGYETGFQYSNGTYAVKVWTTFLEKEDKLRDKSTDAGWVIIVKGDELKYCAHHFTRKNQNFFLSLARYAWIAKWKIDNTPLCSCESCGKEMQIHRKKGSRKYFWICINPDIHEKPEFKSWDYGIGQEAKNFLNIRRENTQKYVKKNKELGKNPNPKAKNRKVRTVGRPKNLKK